MTGNDDLAAKRAVRDRRACDRALEGLTRRERRAALLAEGVRSTGVSALIDAALARDHPQVARDALDILQELDPDLVVDVTVEAVDLLTPAAR